MVRLGNESPLKSKLLDLISDIKNCNESYKKSEISEKDWEKIKWLDRWFERINAS